MGARASIAGRCVFRQNPQAFWKFYDWDYNNQDDLNGENLKSKVLGWAAGNGLNSTQLEMRIDTKATDAEVQANINEGKAVGVRGTPSLFINGKKSATVQPAGLQEMIQKELDIASAVNHLLAGSSLAVLTASAQTVVERPRFEAAAVQRSATTTNPETVISGGVLRGERYQLSKATMLDLIRIAWNVDPKIVLGGPNWLELDRFDIAARAPAETPLRDASAYASVSAGRAIRPCNPSRHAAPTLLRAHAGQEQTKASGVGWAGRQRVQLRPAADRVDF